MLSNWTFFAINRHGQSIYSGETEEQDGTKGKEALLDEAFHEQLYNRFSVTTTVTTPTIGEITAFFKQGPEDANCLAPQRWLSFNQRDYTETRALQQAVTY